MLIVEDNFDLQEFLKSIFEKQYNILLADNGETALKCIIENMPDIILSDIVMPKTDGIELCKKIKNEISISLIPIILLTAKAEIDNMIDGIEEGADAYITKPFNVHYLESQVRNLIKNRKLLYKRFSLNVDLLPKEISNNKLDQKFLQKITDYIEENIGNEKLSPNEIADHVFLSHSQTYRKIKALTGQNINEFIRTIRMKKALKLLLNGENNITEITYKIGISSPAYFTKCFKEQFGKTPSNFLSSRKR
jgi:YesN/AraC family two-component response regulator